MPEALLVTGAGDPSIDGFYEEDLEKIGARRRLGDERSCYRKAGTRYTINFNSGDGRWYICKDHGGSWYVARSLAPFPPEVGWEVGQKGTAPAPVVLLANSDGLAGMPPHSAHRSTSCCHTDLLGRRYTLWPLRHVPVRDVRNNPAGNAVGP